MIRLFFYLWTLATTCWTIWMKVAAFSGLLMGFGSLTHLSAQSGGELGPVAERFASETVVELPDFQKHVSPLLSRLGCNGRSCHGSFQGQGGFRLSLFGFDFAADHAALTTEGAGRVNLDFVDKSLILTKPTGGSQHGGGELFELGSWQYNLLKSWVLQGAKISPENAELLKLMVEPAELVFSDSGQSQGLKVSAFWTDGVVEDVTPLCRFLAKHPSVVDVNDEGVVTNCGYGDSQVVVFYDNGVQTVPVYRPYPTENRVGQSRETDVSRVDELIGAKLDRLNLHRSPIADDLTFLRRVYLDLTGTLPAPAEVQQFVSDSSINKRQKKIEDLLNTPAYVAWQTTFLCDISGNNSQELRDLSYSGELASQQWYDWIRERVQANISYAKIVEGLVLSQSREPSESFYDYCATMSQAVATKSSASLVTRSSMPYYWMRRDQQDRESRAIAYAQNFLGVQIQCAQCHKHPFDRWTQRDFELFSRFFTGMELERGRAQSPADKADFQKILADLGFESGRFDNALQKKAADAVKNGQVVPFPQLRITRPKLTALDRQTQAGMQKGKGSRGPIYYAEGKLLGGEPVSFRGIDDVRTILLKWTVSDDNPYFAKAYVNRVWARFFGAGLVNPVDDLNLANPPSHPELLDYLAREFVRSGFDMKWLHREIANSRTYQTAWEPSESNQLDERNFSRAMPRRLPAEVVVDAMIQACAGDTENQQFLSDVETRAIALAGTVFGRSAKRDRNNGFALEAFGKSTRSNNCDCDRSNETSLIQTVYLQNDRDVHFWIGNSQSWVSQETGQELEKKQRTALMTQMSGLKQQLARLEKRRRSLQDQTHENQAQISEKVATLQNRLDEITQKLSGIPLGHAMKSQDELIELAYLRTLSRFPLPEERDACRAFMDQSDSLRAGLSGVLWTLINTKEFLVNH